jgi:hypothetical protein
MFRLDPTVNYRLQYFDSSCNKFTIMRNLLWRSVGLVLLTSSTKLTFLTDLLFVQEAESLMEGTSAIL